mmetsp:Transcript_63726/g.177224  ORF Transcript_63726/g.177224 Transcript_63726/m.177224 type:complete len:356 (+) Transcript_63726:1556-2623(+)
MLQHGHRERQPHAPARGKLRHRLIQHFLCESDTDERFAASIVDADFFCHLDHELQAVQGALAHLAELGIVHMDTLEVCRHANDAMRGDLLHQRRLARAVVAHDAVTAVFLHLQGRVPEKEVARTIHEQHILDVKECLRIVATLVPDMVEFLAKRRAHGGLREVGEFRLKFLGTLATETDCDFEAIAHLGSDLWSTELPLHAFLDDGTRDNATMSANVAWKFLQLGPLVEHALRGGGPLHEAACRVLAVHHVLHFGRDAGHDVFVLALRALTLGWRRREDKRHSRGHLRRRFQLGGLHEAVENLHGELLSASAHGAVVKFEEQRPDAWEDGLLELRRPAGVFPDAICHTFHGRIRV